MTDPQFPPPSPNGVPSGSPVPPVPVAPGYQPPAGPAYPNQGPPAPQYQAPPGAYPAPVGGYAAPAGGYQPSEAPSSPRSSALGIIAFALSVVAAVVATIIAGAAGYQIGFELPTVAQQIDGTTSDLSFLAPVREQVLMGEISFWVGTLAGITAIVLGIMAIVKRAGRAWGITALILGVLGPVIFFTVLVVTLGLGAGAGSASYLGS